MAQKQVVVEAEVIDESSNDSHDSSKEKVYEGISNEIQVLSKAAAIYFEKYNQLHQESETKKKYGAMSDLMTNSVKAHKAAFKYVIEHSDVHKEHERVAKKVLPNSAFDNLRDWLDDVEKPKESKGSKK